jgi:hypothetical protein
VKSECRNCGYYGLYAMLTNSGPDVFDERLEFRWSVSNEPDSSGKRSCSFYVNGREVASAIGNEDDLRAICLGTWLASAFKGNLTRLKIRIGKMSEMADVAEIVQSCGYQIRFIFGKRDYEVYRLVAIPKLSAVRGAERCEVDLDVAATLAAIGSVHRASV